MTKENTNQTCQLLLAKALAKMLRGIIKGLKPKKTAEKEQNARPVERHRIRAWLWGVSKELYGITVKSFFDSVMGK